MNSDLVAYGLRQPVIERFCYEWMFQLKQVLSLILDRATQTEIGMRRLAKMVRRGRPRFEKRGL